MVGSDQQDHYDVLGVPPEATEDEIRKAYRWLARKFHPDQNPDDPRAAVMTKRINAAYEVLGDFERRAAYDRAAGRRVDARDGVTPSERPPAKPAGSNSARAPWHRWPTRLGIACTLAMLIMVGAGTIHHVSEVPPGAAELNPVIYDRRTEQPVSVSPDEAQAGLVSGQYALNANGPKVRLIGRNGKAYKAPPDNVAGALATGSYRLSSAQSFPTPPQSSTSTMSGLRGDAGDL
jgi:curved DNA-binding protein CbpA